MKKKVIIIYQEQYRRLLEASLASDVDVVAWLSVDNAAGMNAGEVIAAQVIDYFCLMISKWALKTEIKEMLAELGVADSSILDVYKAYMAGFPKERYKRILDHCGSDPLDGLVLGISHGVAGILENKMPGKVCNFCESSQDIFYNLKVLERVCEEYPEKIANLKYVIFDMFDYTYFNFDTLLTGAYDGFVEESGFLCESRYFWNKEKTPEQLNAEFELRWAEGNTPLQQELLGEIFPALRENDDELYRGFTIYKERKHFLTEEEISIATKYYRAISLQTKVFENTIAFQIDNFEKILKKLYEINPNMKVYLLLIPKHISMEKLDSVANLRWKPFFEGIINEFKELYPFIELLDMKNCEDFSADSSLYFDISHFNFEGASRFTEYLAEVIDGK